MFLIFDTETTTYNEIDAAKAYDVKAIELFGEFANINFSKIVT